MNRSRFLTAVVLGSCLLQTVPGFAQAAPAKPTSEQTRDAGRHFQRGVALFNEADYAGALAEFKKAYELAPTPTVLFNIGQTHFQLRSYAAALTAFEKYLGEAPANAEHRADAEANLETLRTRVGKIDVIAADGTEVTIDDDVIGKEPLPPIQTAVGRRKVTAFKDGQQQVRFVEVAAGETVKVEMKIASVARNDTTTTYPPAAESKSSALPAVLWIGSGALLAGAVVTGIVALGKSSDLSDERGKPAGATSRSQLDDLQSKTKTFALVTDILGGAAIITGGVALYVTLKKSSTTGANLPSPSNATQVGVGVGPSHVALQGTF